MTLQSFVALREGWTPGRAAAPLSSAPTAPALSNVSRRSFLEILGLAGTFTLMAPLAAGAYEPYPTGGESMPRGLVWDPKVFVSIAPDGTVTITAHRSEMGTGVRTSLPMVLADEMGADWAKVKIVQAPGDEPTYGNQDTDGSRSMRHHIQTMRVMGAAVRTMLEQAAAKQWGVPVSQVEARVHVVVDKATGRQAGFGELAKAAMDLPVPPIKDLVLKPESAFRYIGKGNLPLYDMKAIVTGTAVYGSDVRRPGQLYAVVARPPVYGGKAKSWDAAAAKAVPGVVEVIEIPGTPEPAAFMPMGGVAVVARNTWAAMLGREKLNVQWEDGPNATYDSAAYAKRMREIAAKPGKVVRNQGDAEAALAKAAKVYTAEYYQPHMAHASMETPHALAIVKDGRCECWAPAQSPYAVRTDLAKFLGLDVADVTVHVTLLGGGFGRKSKGDFALEAAYLSKAMGGAPVLLTWTREDDIRNSYYHTTSVERIEAGIDEKGKVVAWRHRSVAPTILSTFAPAEHQFAIELGMGLVDNPFDIPNLRCENGAIKNHVRIGWFRSVSNIPRAWAVQSFVCELAHELKRDHKELLLELLGPPRKIDPVAAGIEGELWNYGDPYSVYPIDTGRLRAVVELACEKAGWGRPMPPRTGLGLAVHRSFLTYVASVVEVAVAKDGTVTIPRIDTAVDCGFAANPERIRAQFEGAAVMGQTLCFHSAVTFKNGRAEQSNYHDYEMVRMTNFPREVRVHIVPHPFSVPAAGVGEPGVPPIAPAIANAIFAATGKRIRDLPIDTSQLREA